MKVLYVAWEYPKLSETFVSSEIAALLERGIELRVISMRQPDAATVESSSIATTAVMGRVPGVPSLRGVTRRGVDDDWRVGLWADAALRKARDSILRNWEPDIVHAPFGNRPAGAADVFGRRLCVPWTMTLHARDWIVDCSPKSLRLKVAAASRVFAISHVTKREVLQKIGHAGECEKISVVRASVAVDAPVRRLERSGNVLLYAGRLVRKKGVDTFIRSLASPALADYHGLIIGNGPELSYLRDLSRSIGVSSRVEFTGSAPNDVVRGAMASSRAIVLPARVADDGDIDGIPVALMEAGLMRCPVITTRLGGIPELIADRVTGCLVEPDAPEQIARAVSYLDGNESDEEQIVSRLYSWVMEEFAAPKQAERLERVWKSVLTEPRRLPT